VCAGLAGGRTGVQIVERLTSEGLLNDFVRIKGESRTSTAVVDPTSNVYTEINEWGPEVEEHELAILGEKLAYLARGAEFVVFSGSLPRGVEDDFYFEAVREGNRRGVPTILDSEGEPLRRGIEGEPWLVSPNVREAEQLVGHEFSGDDDLITALDEIADLGARNVMITTEAGCYALFREDRAEIRLQATSPHLEPISEVGSGDALIAGFIAARLAGKPYNEAVRAAVATGAASVLEAGAGRFDVREVNRLTSVIAVRQLEPVAGET
jgi:1-phosphofructokinase/tagatose 6-phosphate kinase